MKTKPKKKVYSLKKVKAKAWTAFSLYIRTRDCLKATGTPNLGICVTCGKQCDIKQLQAGHFIGGRTNSVLFVEDNCFAQCLTEESNLTANGESVSISDIEVGDEVEAFDEETFEKKMAVVEDVKSFIPPKLYEIKLEDGKSFYATGDHKVVANGSWLSIEEMLQGKSAYDILEL